MDDVEEKLHGLLEFDHGDRPSLYPFCELVHGDKQVCVAPGCSFEGSDQIKPPNHKWSCDGDHLECLGQEVSLSSIVLAPFIGVYDLLDVGYYNGLVEALSECVPNQGSRRGVVTVDPTVDIAQLKLPLFDGDIELSDPGVASFVEFALYKNKGLGVSCEPSGFRLVCW